MKQWHNLKLAISAVCLVAAVSCGDGNQDPRDILAQDDSTTLLDVDVQDSIDTAVAAETTRAGIPVKVDCLGSGWDPAQVRVLVWDPRTSGGAGGETVEGTAPDAAEPPRIDPDSMTLPEGVTLEDGRLTFTVTGTFYVSCYAPDTGMLDEDPAWITVEPGMAAWIDSAVEPVEIKAGEWVHITCTAEDKWGNAITTGFIPVVTPQDGIRPSGLDVQFITAGDFDVGCGLENTETKDETPVPVKVTANIAKKIYTIVEPTLFRAGESATVNCEVRDFYENRINGFPVSVQHPDALGLTGKTLYTEKAGLYTVKCVPQLEDWSKFQLFPVSVTVTPANPEIITLKVVPDKPVYGTNQRIQVTMTTSDRFGNIVPNAPFAPVVITPLSYETMVEGVPTVVASPGDGIKMLNGESSGEFLLKKEGKYVLTFRLLEDQTIYKDLEIRVDGSGPMLSIIYPARGATIKGKPSVTIVASLNDTLSGISKLVINGQELTPADYIRSGQLTYQLPKIHQGLNTVEIAIENSMGQKASETRGFQFSYKYYDVDSANPDASMIPDAVKAYLGRSFFDDGDHTMPADDVATIIENIVAGLKIESLIPNPVASAGPYKVFIRHIGYDKPTVSLSPEKDHLLLGLVINNFDMEVEAEGKCEFIIDWCPDVTGFVEVDSFVVDMAIYIVMDENGVFQSSLEFVDFQINGLDIDLDGFIGDLLDWLIDSLVDIFEDAIETAIKSQIETMLNDMMGDLLSKFRISESIPIPSILGSEPTEISFSTVPSAFVLDHPGFWLDMDAVIYGPAGVGHDNLGSIARADCLKANVDEFEIPQDAQVGFAAFDDVLNQALYAVWNTGTLNLSIGDDILGGLDLPAIVLKKVDLDFFEAPILTSCNTNYVFDPETFTGDCTPDADQILQLQLGDLYARIEAEIFGSPMYMEVFVQAIALADMYPGEDEAGNSTIAIRLLNVPMIMLDIIEIDPAYLGSMGMTKEQFYNDIIAPMITPLLAQLPTCEELFEFAIPVIDLNSLMADIPEGSNVKFYVEQFFRDNGFTTVQGHLE